MLSPERFEYVLEEEMQESIARALNRLWMESILSWIKSVLIISVVFVAVLIAQDMLNLKLLETLLGS